MLLLPHYMHRETDRIRLSTAVWSYCFDATSPIHVKNLETYPANNCLRTMIRQLLETNGAHTDLEVERGRTDLLKHLRFVEAVGLERFTDFMILNHPPYMSLEETRTIYEFLTILPADVAYPLYEARAVLDKDKTAAAFAWARKCQRG